MLDPKVLNRLDVHVCVVFKHCIAHFNIQLQLILQYVDLRDPFKLQGLMALYCVSMVNSLPSSASYLAPVTSHQRIFLFWSNILYCKYNYIQSILHLEQSLDIDLLICFLFSLSSLDPCW